jgi:hypothetical protein
MKNICAILLIFCFSSVFSQQIQTVTIFDGHGNLIGGSHIKSLPPHQMVLTDSSTNFKFVLDSAHIYVTAYNSVGDILWKTDPWKDNNIKIYRTKRPIIVNMVFGVNPGYSDEDLQFDTNTGYSDSAKKGKKVIWIQYINTQAGFIDLKTGAFHFMWQE